MSEESCGTCRFLRIYGAVEKKCQRMPPIPILMPKMSAVAQAPQLVVHCDFPVTKETNWCGEYKPKIMQ